MMSFYHSLKITLADIRTMVWRNLIHYQRQPRLLVFSTIQPVMFLLLFTYVFGGAIQTLAGNYINFLLPGILIQTVLFGSIQTGLGLAEDLGKGLIDRFRSLPMARSAVLAGRTLTDTLRNIYAVSLMILVGMLLGFRISGSFGEALLAILLAVLFGLAFSWVSATIGLLAKNAETAQVMGFIWVFPLVFASSIFVPIESMPDWLEAFAKVNPITVTTNAVRALTLGQPLGDNLWQSVIWMAGILLVFIPLAVNRYRKSV